MHSSAVAGRYSVRRGLHWTSPRRGPLETVSGVVASLYWARSLLHRNQARAGRLNGLCVTQGSSMWHTGLDQGYPQFLRHVSHVLFKRAWISAPPRQGGGSSYLSNRSICG